MGFGVAELGDTLEVVAGFALLMSIDGVSPKKEKAWLSRSQFSGSQLNTGAFVVGSVTFGDVALDGWHWGWRERTRSPEALGRSWSSQALLCLGREYRRLRT